MKLLDFAFDIVIISTVWMFSGHKSAIWIVTQRSFPPRKTLHDDPNKWLVWFPLHWSFCEHLLFLGQVVLDVAKTRSPIPFVIQWISRHIPDIEKWRTFIPDTQHSPNQAAVNELLNQFFSNSAFPARYSQTCRNLVWFDQPDPSQSVCWLNCTKNCLWPTLTLMT